MELEGGGVYSEPETGVVQCLKNVNDKLVELGHGNDFSELINIHL